MLLLALPRPVCPVAQVLLLARHAIEFVERTVHFARHLVHLAAAARGLEIFEQRLQLIEHALGIGEIAVPRHLVELIEQRLQVLRGDRPQVAVDRLVAALLVAALGLLGELVQELVERGAQLVGELADLLVRGAASEGVAQLLLQRPQVVFGIRQIAVFDA